jgi:hemerythrin-like domain-containing protein
MTVDHPPDLRPSYLEHRAMRIDAERLQSLVASARPADADRLTALSCWYTGYEGAIHDHHTAEEAVVYPALLERDPSFAEADGELEGEHRVLADRLAVLHQSLQDLPSAAGGGTWEQDQAEAVRSDSGLREILELHLPHEEDVAFSRYRRVFTADEFADLGKAAWPARCASRPLPRRRKDRSAEMPTVPWRRVVAPQPETEYLVMASRLPLRQLTKVPRFMGLTLSVVRQLERSEGLVGYSLRAHPLAKTFWTLSAWTDDAALSRFARELPHRAVIARLRPDMATTRFVTWTCRGQELPASWYDAVQRLLRPAEPSPRPPTAT